MQKPHRAQPILQYSVNEHLERLVSLISQKTKQRKEGFAQSESTLMKEMWHQNWPFFSSYLILFLKMLVQVARLRVFRAKLTILISMLLVLIRDAIPSFV